jgi:hypothetical protein
MRDPAITRRSMAGRALRRARDADYGITVLRGHSVIYHRPLRLPAGTTDVMVLVDSKGRRSLCCEIDFSFIEDDWRGLEVVA